MLLFPLSDEFESLALQNFTGASWLSIPAEPEVFEHGINMFLSLSDVECLDLTLILQFIDSFSDVGYLLPHLILEFFLLDELFVLLLDLLNQLLFLLLG
jgi:hypothetical protein